MSVPLILLLLLITKNILVIQKVENYAFHHGWCNIIEPGIPEFAFFSPYHFPLHCLLLLCWENICVPPIQKSRASWAVNLIGFQSEWPWLSLHMKEQGLTVSLFLQWWKLDPILCDCCLTERWNSHWSWSFNEMIFWPVWDAAPLYHCHNPSALQHLMVRHRLWLQFHSSHCVNLHKHRHG